MRQGGKERGRPKILLAGLSLTNESLFSYCLLLERTSTFPPALYGRHLIKSFPPLSTSTAMGCGASKAAGVSVAFMVLLLVADTYAAGANYQTYDVDGGFGLAKKNQQAPEGADAHTVVRLPLHASLDAVADT